MTLILSGTDGLSDIDGTASTPAIRGTDANTGIFFPAADTIAFAEGGVEAMRIDSSGYILGGYSSAFDMSPAGTGQYAGISASTSSPSDWKFGALSFSADGTANGMLFVKSRSATVGTNTVVQSGDALGNIVWRGADGTNYINAASIQAFVDGTPGTNDMPGRLIFATTADGAASQTERMRIDSSGNLLVGKTSTANNATGFYVAGSGNADYGMVSVARPPNTTMIQIVNSSGNTVVGQISQNGSNTTYSTSSDYRLKENIAPMTGALSRVAALKPCVYTWKATGETDEGFIAHELAEVCPSAVTGEKDAVNEDGSIKPQGIDTSFLVATLTAAIQEQQQMIQTLQAKVAALEAKG